MALNGSHAKSSKLSEAKFRLLVKLFAADPTAVRSDPSSGSPLSKFRGMHPQTFLLRLKEIEFRYNPRHQNIGRVILKICREKLLKLFMVLVLLYT